jgi:hypothetical protein
VLSGAVRILIAGGLVVVLPLMTRLPATGEAFATQAWWLAWAPPAWFAGLERWLLGDAAKGLLAAQAVAATIGALGIAVASYVRLYRRFDRLTFQPAPGQARFADRAIVRWSRGAAPVSSAVRRFVWLTIRRSVLHQGLVAGLLACAVALVLDSLLSADWRAAGAFDDGRLWTLLWAPMTRVFVAVPAIRVALSVPLDLRANWIFRMAEDVEGRAEAADASVRTVLVLAVALPIALVAPLQWWALGPGSVAVLLVEASIGWLLVELRMSDWVRIPFTFAYLPGKGFVPQMCVKAFAGYVVFTFATGLMLRASLRHHAVALILGSTFSVTAAALRRARGRRARRTALLFEEQLPMDVMPLRLGAD